MKKHLTIFSILTVSLLAASCEKNKEAQPVAISIQLTSEGENFAVEGVNINLSDAAASFTLEAATDDTGAAAFSVKPGAYTATVSYVTSENGQRLAYSGSNNAIVVAEATEKTYTLALSQVASQQIIIKELYTTGCPQNDATKSFSDDAYVILYNNSDIEADATNVVFGFLAPYNAHGNNKYYTTEGKLLYEDEGWVPSYGAIWWFTAKEVKIPAYSQLVVAFFGAIDFTQTISASVNLANENYYWMSNNGIIPYTSSKYTTDNVIPTEHYLSCYPFTQGTAWAVSSICPAFFIGNMPKAEAEALSKDSEHYDSTMGTSNAFKVVKFPQANVIGAVEVWQESSVATSKLRFPAKINSGYIAITNKKGYTVYRNVDKDATEALPENAGKLVYNYSGALDEALNGEQIIDAEASLKNGAHIIYKQSNNTANDFHIRKISSLK